MLNISQTLKLIDINNFLNSNLNGDIIVYADDTVLRFNDDTWEGVYFRTEHGFAKGISILN